MEIFASLLDRFILFDLNPVRAGEGVVPDAGDLPLYLQHQ
jgi:hypothetical protein